ncbi:hypothetical protein CBR_g53944 [Chara braunii]|uniref:F-box domain-containing protein n=1 Tax=Chara braunii TaxID=69332 RepID=A0A388MBF2_CHABU|nr:hypothetical protein CBR_g53944 [Chara braunii]|eukprot:GBG91886.1 hypothetical protein CBR_g53944 [Chara braunii]
MGGSVLMRCGGNTRDVAGAVDDVSASSGDLHLVSREELNGESEDLSGADTSARVSGLEGSMDSSRASSSGDAGDAHHANRANESSGCCSVLRGEDSEDLKQGICGVEDACVNAGPDWSDMVDEVLALIFSFLTVRERFRAGTVCKRWCRASHNPACWTKVRMATHSEKCIRDVLLRSRGQLVDLSLDFTKHSMLRMIGYSCPLLQRVDFCFLGFGEDWLPSVEAFVHGCPQVHSLKLWPISRRPSSIHMSLCIRILLTGLPHLLSLSLRSDEISDRELSIISETAPQLEALELSGKRITDPSLDLIGRKLDNLRVFVIH